MIFDILIYNWGFILNLLIPIFVILFLKLTNKKYSLDEFVIQAGVTILYLIATYYILFSTTTDLKDVEYWGGKVEKIVKEEKYEYTYDCSYQNCTGSGSNRTCRTVHKTCTATEPEKRYIKTSNNEKIDISISQWNKAKFDFSATERKMHRSNQTSYSKLKGEGDIWNSYPKVILPTSVSHSYINLVVAAKDNVLNENVLQTDIDLAIKDGVLKEYPTLKTLKYGETQLNRIIDTTGKINVKKYEELLNKMSVEVGKSKQANPIIYFTNQGRDFKHLLKSYWKGAKKNDVVLILGINSEAKILWSDSISWSKNTDFDIEAGMGFEDFNINEFKGDVKTIKKEIKTKSNMKLDMKFIGKDLAENGKLNLSNVSKLKPVSDRNNTIKIVNEKITVNENKIINRFKEIIIKYYVRKPMKEFEYLKENISLDLKWQIFIFVLNFIISFFLALYMLRNEVTLGKFFTGIISILSILSVFTRRR